MDACTIAGESTDAIVMDESPADERDIREACQRCVLFLFFLIASCLVIVSLSSRVVHSNCAHQEEALCIRHCHLQTSPPW